MIAIRPGFFSNVKFPMGHILATPGALEALADSGEAPAQFLMRHVGGDWGDGCDGDKELNDQALTDGSRLLSAYHTNKEVKIWIITEAADEKGNRAATTILLPDEY